MAKAIHMMVRVLEEARSVDFYSRPLASKSPDRVDFPDFTLIYMSNAEAPLRWSLRLTRAGRTSTTSATATAHVAFVVDGLEAEQ